MDDPSITASIITAALTVLGGGVVSSIVTAYMTSFRMEREHTFRKLDELYAYCAKYVTLGRKITQNFGHKDWERDDTLKADFDRLKKEQNELALEIDRLYDIYFFELRSRFDTLRKLMDRDMMLARQLNMVTPETYVRVVQEQEQIIQAMNKQISNLINDIRDAANRVRYTFLVRLYKKWHQFQTPELELP